MPTVFTKIITREIPSNIIWENDRYIAFLDINPMRPGHTLVVPKQEVNHLFDLDHETYHGLFDAVKYIGEAVKSATGAERIGLIVEGFFVPHVHVHLVPINCHEDLTGENKEEQSEDQLEEMMHKIQTMLPQE